MAGPYVDYICTHKYTFTVSVPMVDEGRFLGVAGADILAGEVERMLLPGLSRLGRAAILVSGNGRVIASSTASILPGVVFGPSDRAWPGTVTSRRLAAVDTGQREYGNRADAASSRAVAWPNRNGTPQQNVRSR